MWTVLVQNQNMGLNLVNTILPSESGGYNGRAQWCTPVVPATQEAEAGGSQVRGQPGKLRKTLSQNEKGLGMQLIAKEPLESIHCTKERGRHYQNTLFGLFHF